LVAADATAARVMSHNVDQVQQIVMGYEMGLGEMREEAIEIVGEKLDNLRVEWRPATLANVASNSVPDFPPAPCSRRLAARARTRHLSGPSSA